MTNSHALWIAGIVVAGAAVWFAFKSAPTTATNSNALAGASPPPQKVAGPSGTLTIKQASPLTSYKGALIVNGSNYAR